MDCGLTCEMCALCTASAAAAGGEGADGPLFSRLAEFHLELFLWSGFPCLGALLSLVQLALAAVQLALGLPLGLCACAVQRLSCGLLGNLPASLARALLFTAWTAAFLAVPNLLTCSWYASCGPHPHHARRRRRTAWRFHTMIEEEEEEERGGDEEYAAGSTRA